MISISRYCTTLLLLVNGVLLTQCDEPEPVIDTTVKTYALANELADATYPYNNGKLARFAYTGDRVTSVSLIDQSGESPYLTINYLDEEELLKIRSVYYADEEHFRDTLVYDGNNLIKIIQTYAEDNGVDTYTRDVVFSYNEYGQVTEAKDGETRVEFLEYERGNFTRTKYYQPDLLYDTWIDFDDKPSPFGKLGYLNFVLFANNNLQGPGYLTLNNMLKVIQDEYGTRVYTQQFKIEYVYDSKDRPASATWKRLNPGDYRRDDFYSYND